MSPIPEDEKRRSCWTCAHNGMCFAYQNIRQTLETTPHMFHKAPRKSVEVFDVLAETCNRFKHHLEDRIADDWLDWSETLAKFLPSLWELAGYDYDKMEALLEQQIVLGRYFDMLSPEMVAVMEREHD